MAHGLKKKCFIVFVLFFAMIMLVIPAAGWAYSDPTGPPPADNAPPPLNIGPAAQSKAGDLEVENFKARGGVTLGGIFRNSWLEAGSSCAWEGTKCFCASDDSSIGSIGTTLGLTCGGGQITDFKVMSFNFSSREGVCPSSPPADCAAGYGLIGATGLRGSAVMRTLEAAVAVIDSYVVRTVRGIGKLLRRIF